MRRLVVRAIGSPAVLVEELGKSAIRWAGPDEFADLPLIRPADSHKVYTATSWFGRVPLASPVQRCWLGQARSKLAWMVTIATPDSIQPIVASHNPNI